MFRRRASKQADAVPELPDDEPDAPAPGPATSGPWDADDAPEDDLVRVDLGGLRLPAVADVEVRLETDPAGAVVAVLLVHGASTMQLGAFAAPRREGIWDDVRGELLESLRSDGGDGSERDGPFGAELLAAVPGPQGRQPARFVGIDGPRWFLRGVFTGPAATDPVQAGVLEGALRNVVVVRGGDPLPARDPLGLTLPREVLEAQADAAADEAEPDDAPRAPGMPQRGPEITETR